MTQENNGNGNGGAPHNGDGACIRVCRAAGCISAGSEDVHQALTDELKNQGMRGRCAVKGVGCMGLCAAGPLVSVDPGDHWYHGVKPQDAADILRSVDDGPVERLQLDTQIPFFQRQRRVVLENMGRIDPEKLQDYLDYGGYEALSSILAERSPSEVIDEISRSGLRGRGGAGYPTGLKWGTVAKAAGERKYVVCNADEGDPGAFMDRSILESDPHRILEGMAIAAYAVGANHGYIYIRAEYPLAVSRLKGAIRQAEREGYLGNHVCGTPFEFSIEVRLGAGAFVCGEETALLHSIEGQRGAPRPRPPYPAQSGLWGYPTLINNVETLGNIPTIIRKGAEWFASIGTEHSKGTKVFALAGGVNNTGLIEVPMGISLREIVFDVGGGTAAGAGCKGVQTGGPSGGCIPAEHLDKPVDYESLAALGSIMGSGGMIVIDEKSCMVDVAKYFIEFCKSESCGKCVPCRVGTSHLHALLDQITRGEAAESDLELLVELCDLVKNASLCGLGQSAPNPILSTLQYFREEYDAHIHEGHCPAGVCKVSAVKEVAS